MSHEDEVDEEVEEGETAMQPQDLTLYGDIDDGGPTKVAIPIWKRRKWLTSRLVP